MVNTLGELSLSLSQSLSLSLFLAATFGTSNKLVPLLHHNISMDAFMLGLSAALHSCNIVSARGQTHPSHARDIDQYLQILLDFD